jgi:hypothetical protein
MKWIYEFSVWPAERRFSRQVFDLFQHLTTRIAMEFTEEEFNLFRAELASQGITLREIGRVPYQDQQIVL